MKKKKTKQKQIELLCSLPNRRFNRRLTKQLLDVCINKIM